MGQYYKPVILGEGPSNVKAWMYSHDYDNGLKLMEHSWIVDKYGTNNFVSTFESLLKPGSPYHKSRVVWAGDYADPEPNLIEIREGGESESITLYDLCNDRNNLRPDVVEMKDHPFVVNHTKKQYVDKREVPRDSEGWAIHPLPLLTCEGNGRGGGDYHGEESIVGSWARDVISIEVEAPSEYEKIKFNLKE